MPFNEAIIVLLAEAKLIENKEELGFNEPVLQLGLLDVIGEINVCVISKGLGTDLFMFPLRVMVLGFTCGICRIPETWSYALRKIIKLSLCFRVLK